jgi:hypothetical protein
MRTLFALHGQLVVSTEDVFDDIMNRNSRIHFRWQVAVKVYGRPERPVPVVLIFADYNKVAQHIMMYKFPTCKKWDPGRNCDPMDNWEKYEQNIRRELPRSRRSNLTIVDVISTSSLSPGSLGYHFLMCRYG